MTAFWMGVAAFAMAAAAVCQLHDDHPQTELAFWGFVIGYIGLAWMYLEPR